MGLSDAVCSVVDNFRKGRLNSSNSYRSVLGGLYKQWIGVSRRALITTRSRFCFPRQGEAREGYISHGFFHCLERKKELTVTNNWTQEILVAAISSLRE